MKSKLLVTGMIATALMAMPIAPASAHDFYRGHGHYDYHGGGHGGGLLLGILGAGAAVVGAAAYIATAPVRAIADAGEADAPPPAPVYAAPQPYYAPQQVYYAPQPVAVYQPRHVVYSYPAYAYAPGYYYR